MKTAKKEVERGMRNEYQNITLNTAEKTEDGQQMRNKRKQIRNKSWNLYLLLLPALIYVGIFCYAPLFGLQIAFKEYNSYLGILASPWVGFQHFVNFVTATNFWPLIKNTLTLSVYSLAVGFPLPIILALIINEVRNRTYKRVVQTISYAPYFISTVVVVGMIFTLFSVDHGVINSIIKACGGDPVYFMSSADLFPTIYVFSGVWQGMGWSSIIYVGALSSVDQSLHEAATLDGASRFQRIWHINLPAIRSVVVVSLLLSIGGLMSVGFEKAWLMQTAGNITSSEIISTFVYKVTIAAQIPQYSFGTAVDLFNSVINITLLVIANLLAKKFGQESLW